MKKIIVLLYALSMLLGTHAQVRLGIKGGVNMLNIGFEKLLYNENNKAGVFIGPTALIAIPVKGFELDASLLFDQRGVETETPDLSGGRTFWTTTTQHQITIPVNVRYNLTSGEGTRLFIFAGPQLGINIGKRENETDYGTFVFNKSSFSINTGIGLLFSQHFQVSANYNVVCGKNAEIWINRQWGIGQQVNKSRFNAWQFSVGYYF